VIKGLGDLNFHSTAPRCNGAGETPYAGPDPGGWPVRRYTEAQLLRLGAITLVVMLVVMAAAFNLSKFPGFGGDTYQAYFADASGLHKGNMVQVGGIRAGRVQDLQLKDGKVLVTFEVDHGVEFGKDSRASVEVLNLLGEKYLDLVPAGAASSTQDTPIPVDRTSSSYDIVGVFGDLTKTTEQIDTHQLDQALDVVSDTVNHAAPGDPGQLRRHRPALPVGRLAHDQIQALLRSSADVSKLLADRSKDIVDLMQHSSLVFKEVERRKDAIHRLLVNARELALQLRGVATDNQAQLAPRSSRSTACSACSTPRTRSSRPRSTPSVRTRRSWATSSAPAPWFDAYAVNLAAIPTGEFLPGPPD
jgi:phospholipid/cholesterol/gamma-HCH transport system substrate-binding protein